MSVIYKRIMTLSVTFLRVKAQNARMITLKELDVLVFTETLSVKTRKGRGGSFNDSN